MGSFSAKELAVLADATEKYSVVREILQMIRETDSLKEQLEQSLQRCKNLEKEKLEMDAFYKVKISELEGKALKSDQQRILELADKLACSSAAMGGPTETTRSEKDCDPVSRLQAELNHFCRQFDLQGSGFQMLDRMTRNLKAVAALELKTRKGHAITAATDFTSPPAKEIKTRESCQVETLPTISTESSEALQPTVDMEPSPSGHTEPRKKRRLSPSLQLDTSSPQLEQTVKIEQNDLEHRPNPSTKYRGKHACTCGRVYDKSYDLRYHINQKAGITKPLCCPYPNSDTDPTICLEEFRNCFQLMEHVRHFHGIVVNLRQCGYCREVVDLGNGGLKKHHLEVHNVVLIDSDDEDEENGEADKNTHQRKEAGGGGGEIREPVQDMDESSDILNVET